MKAMTEQKDFENKLDELCAEFGKMTPHQRVEKLYSMSDEIMLTSSFAAISAMLLKVFSDVNKNQVIHFIQVITLKKLLLTKSI
jgi:phosphoadenosine phosphosulfate reductase